MNVRTSSLFTLQWIVLDFICFIWLGVSLMHCLRCCTRNVQYNNKGSFFPHCFSEHLLMATNGVQQTRHVGMSVGFHIFVQRVKWFFSDVRKSERGKQIFFFFQSGTREPALNSISVYSDLSLQTIKALERKSSELFSYIGRAHKVKSWDDWPLNVFSVLVIRSCNKMNHTS